MKSQIPLLRRAIVIDFDPGRNQADDKQIGIVRRLVQRFHPIGPKCFRKGEIVHFLNHTGVQGGCPGGQIQVIGRCLDCSGIAEPCCSFSR